MPLYTQSYKEYDRASNTFNETSKTEVTAGGDAWNGGQISDVQKYVQYRAK